MVLINTPSELHSAQAKAVLESGRHALVAKPVTNDLAQAVELVEIAKASGRTLSVGQQMRFNRHDQPVALFLDSGALGTVEAMFFQNSKPRPRPATPGKRGCGSWRTMVRSVWSALPVGVEPQATPGHTFFRFEGIIFRYGTKTP